LLLTEYGSSAYGNNIYSEMAVWNRIVTLENMEEGAGQYVRLSSRF